MLKTMSATLRCFEGTKIDTISCCNGKRAEEESVDEEAAADADSPAADSHTTSSTTATTTFNNSGATGSAGGTAEKKASAGRRQGGTSGRTLPTGKPARKKPCVFVDEAADVVILSTFHPTKEELVYGAGEVLVVSPRGDILSVSGKYFESMGLTVGECVKDGKRKLDGFVVQLHDTGMSGNSRTILTMTAQHPKLWSVNPILGVAEIILGTVIVLQTPPSPDLSQLDDS
jgi:hypothetical protein